MPGKNNDPSPSAVQQNHQILCCAFNANGTVFVTGSSDTYARVQCYIISYSRKEVDCTFIVSSHFENYEVVRFNLNCQLQVWNAFKINPDESDQRHHEMDLLSGHENDVNYVQFRFAGHEYDVNYVQYFFSLCTLIILFSLDLVAVLWHLDLLQLIH